MQYGVQCKAQHPGAMYCGVVEVLSVCLEKESHPKEHAISKQPYRERKRRIVQKIAVKFFSEQKMPWLSLILFIVAFSMGATLAHFITKYLES